MNKTERNYTEALNRLNEIVTELENKDCNLDKLSDMVKEAHEIHDFLQKKIYKIEEDVNKILNTKQD